MTVTLHQGDNRETLRRLIDAGVRVHSVVTDPPYGLVSTVKRFGKDGSAAAKSNGATGVFKRASAGFMGSKWDATGIERDPEFWSLIYDILLPGGYVLAFSSPRTGHWQACAMEMAGFVMHPFFGWVYGQGFPKAHNAAKAIDKHLGTPGTIAPTGDPVKRMIPGSQQHATGDWTKTDERQYQPGTYVPGSDEAAQWDGWAYGAQSMKPALEPIYVGQKPFSEKNGVLNLLEHGVGAMNIDGCRVPISASADASQLCTMQRGQRTEDLNGQEWGMSKNGGDAPTVVRQDGRHPANLLHDGSDEVVDMFPDSKGQLARVGPEHGGRETKHCYGDYGPRPDTPPRNDSGSAARFFNCFPPDSDPVFYHGKAKKSDRAGSKHPTVKPIQLMRWLCRLVTPPGGTVLDPFAGSGTTGAAAHEEGFDCVLMEAEAQFAADIRNRFGLVDDGDDFDDLLDDFEDLLQ